MMGAERVAEKERAADLVRFWRAIEMFSPQPVPKTTQYQDDGDGWVFDLEPDDLAPWQAAHELARRRLPPKKTRIFTVFGGLYDVSGVRGELGRVFGDDGKPTDARPAGETATFAFSVNSEGTLVENSATLSACAWAMSRLATPGPEHPHWLDGFDTDENAFVSALNRLSAPALSKADELQHPESPNSTVGHAVTEHLKGAALDAVTAGAKATGTAAKGFVTGGVASVAGPVLGGIAGAVAGTFVEKVLTPPGKNAATPPRSERARPRAARLDLTAGALHEFVDELAEALGIRKTLRVAGLRVRCMVVSEQSAEKPNEVGLLNSFIADDLSRIEREVRSGRSGDALSKYLSDATAIPVSRRVDLRAGPAALLEGVTPARIPLGRWPGDPGKPLVSGQQFAVNQVLGNPAGSAPVFAVNGPPGTGKTTMLRDALAGVVTERGRRLAALGDPLDAFGEILEKLPTGRNFVSVRRLRPDLTGFEMVLATATNDAAANVTAEIPGMSAVRGMETEALAADYFQDLATHYSRDLAASEAGSEAWGLVAAVLGNMTHRHRFAERFWWDDDLGLQAVFRQANAEPDEIDDWSDAVESFRKAERLVMEMAGEREAVADAIRAAGRWRQKIPALQSELERATADCESRHACYTAANASCQEAAYRLDRAERDCAEHVQRKPGFWMLVSTLFKAGAQWRSEDADFRAVRGRARVEFDSLRSEAARLHNELTTAQQRWTERRRALEDAQEQLTAALRRVEDARTRWPDTVPAEDAESDETSLHLRAPWGDEEFLLARSRLFLESLRLHKTFLLHARRSVRGNLSAIADVLKRKADLKPEALQAAWQTLFLAVPMVSTTFASLPRLFAGLGAEALGWLFIDEAGQATPQQAVGGLWRCRRAVIVGDPQQLEPIMTLALPAQNALRRYYGIAGEWLPEHTSVQRVADRLAGHGTYLPDRDSGEKLWVGMPLRVHRRCDRPMFDMSNRMAYDGELMIYGTAAREPYPGENAWLDVRSADSNGKWVPAEGRALWSLLRELAAQGISPEDIRVVSPFRQVVSESRKIANNVFDRRFAGNNVGTVHTVQGQESDVVVVVLGTGPEGGGARKWVTEKPNLLNVAVSRARRRLYVIGNREHWAGLRYVRDMAERLPVRVDLS